jgi:hypothetical protein
VCFSSLPTPSSSAHEHGGKGFRHFPGIHRQRSRNYLVGMGAVVSVDNRARQHSERAIDVLAEVMENGEDQDRIKAANSILDRGYGKPSQAIIAVPASKQQMQMLAALSDDELMAAIQSTRLPRLAPIEAQFTVVPAGTKDDPLLR